MNTEKVQGEKSMPHYVHTEDVQFLVNSLFLNYCVKCHRTKAEEEAPAPLTVLVRDQTWRTRGNCSRPLAKSTAIYPSLRGYFAELPPSASTSFDEKLY